MRDDERHYEVRRLLFGYVKSPSLRHCDQHAIAKLAQEIIRCVDRAGSIWKKWDGQREVLLGSALGRRVPMENLHEFLNPSLALALTRTESRSGSALLRPSGVSLVTRSCVPDVWQSLKRRKQKARSFRRTSSFSVNFARITHLLFRVHGATPAHVAELIGVDSNG